MGVRARVGLATVAATLLLVGGAATALYWLVAGALLESADEALATRGDEVVASLALVATDDLVAPQRRLSQADEQLLQVFDGDGRPLLSVPTAEAAVLDGELAAATTATTVRSVTVGDDQARVLVLSARSRDGAPLTVLVGATLDRREDTLAVLGPALTIGVPSLSLLVAAAATALLREPLRAVERVRRQAAAVDGRQLRDRVEVPPGGDELTRLATSVNAMLDRVERAVGTQRRFVAVASHELRTPLASLTVQLEVLADTLEEAGNDARGDVLALHDEVDRLALLTDGLLVLAEQERDGLALHLAELDLVDVVGSARNRLLDRALASGRAVRVTGSAPTITGDRVLLEQAMTNLVDNALRHGRGDVTIALTTTTEGWCRCAVRDRGTGIDAALVEHATEPFTAGRDSRGAGLGLSIVDAVARAHGGGVVLDGTPPMPAVHLPPAVSSRPA